MLNVHWRGGESFEAVTETGFSINMAAPPSGPSPVEAFMGAAAACSAIDVIEILRKMRLDVVAYRVEVDWERGLPDVYPRPVVSMVVRHVVSGNDLDSALVQKAVKLSDEKYCGILATLRTPPKIVTEFKIESTSDLVE